RVDARGLGALPRHRWNFARAVRVIGDRPPPRLSLPRRQTWEALMSRLIATAAVAAALAMSSPLHAQVPALPDAAPPKVNITLEQRHIIMEIIKSLTVPPAAPDVDVSLGAVAPRSARLQPIPPEVAMKVPQIRSHLFFVKEGKIAIVDPRENRIAEIIE